MKLIKNQMSQIQQEIETDDEQTKINDNLETSEFFLYFLQYAFHLSRRHKRGTDGARNYIYG